MCIPSPIKMWKATLEKQSLHLKNKQSEKHAEYNTLNTIISLAEWNIASLMTTYTCNRNIEEWRVVKNANSNTAYLRCKSLSHSVLPLLVLEQILQLCDLWLVLVAFLLTLHCLVLLSSTKQNNKMLKTEFITDNAVRFTYIVHLWTAL